MARYRLADLPSKETLRLYSQRLADEDLARVEKALIKIAETPRKEGESAFPDLGTILAAIKAQPIYL